MPPLLFLDLALTAAAPTSPRVPIDELMRNDRVVYEERLYHVRGFDPLGVVSPLVYLEDAENGSREVAPLTDLLERGMRHFDEETGDVTLE